jgi:hypothetical protein
VGTAPEVTPVFVLGAVHSGTTILYRMLAYHPSFAWFSQYSMRQGEIPGRWRLPGAAGLDSRLRGVVKHDWRKEEEGIKRLVPRPGEATTIWDFLLAGGADPSVLHRCLSDFCVRYRQDHLLTKLPRFHGSLELLHTAFPKGKFLHIVRDGRPLALSACHKAGARREAGGWPADSLDKAAKYWLHVLDDVRSAQGIDLLEVRYEDLCTDVPGLLSKVLDHVGLDPSGFPFDRCPQQLSNTNQRWLTSASSEELARVTQLEAPALSRYGYLTR